eukprot:3597797-Amphidinium_carterae.1
MSSSVSVWKGQKAHCIHVGTIRQERPASAPPRCVGHAGGVLEPRVCTCCCALCTDAKTRKHQGHWLVTAALLHATW